MNTDHDWAIYYKFDGDRPTEFREIRRFGNRVWQAYGRPKTFGETKTTEFDSDDAVLAAFRTECDDTVRNGFTLTHSGDYGQNGLDVQQLIDAIYEGAKRAFETMRTEHPDQTLTSFGLCSDDCAMILVPAANSKQAIKKARDDESNWNMSEWQFSDGSEYLDPAYRMILPPFRDIPCDVEDDDFAEVVFESCVKALSRLREEGFFGEPNDDLVVLFQVSDSEAAIELNERLNTKATYRRYAKWMGV